MHNGTGRSMDRPHLDELYPLLGHNALAFFYGVGEEDGALLRATLPQETNILLLGKPGSGKTCLAGAILSQLYATNGPEALQVIFLDNGRDLAPPFAEFPQTRAVARRAEQVEAALLLPFQTARPPDGCAPFWLLVVEGLSWEDRAMYEESHSWATLLDLPARFEREEQSGLRGGLLVLSADPHPFPAPFRTTAILAHDRRQIDLRWMRNALEGDLLRRLAAADLPGLFLLERRRGRRKTGVTGLLLAPEADFTDPDSYVKRFQRDSQE